MRIASNKDEPKGSSELGVFLWHDSGARQQEGFVKPETCDLSPTGTYIQTIELMTGKGPTYSTLLTTSYRLAGSPDSDLIGDTSENVASQL